MSHFGQEFCFFLAGCLAAGLFVWSFHKDHIRAIEMHMRKAQWPEFQAGLQEKTLEVEVVPFEPKKVLDIEATFDRAISREQQKRLDEKLQKQAREAEEKARLEPLKQAIDHLIATRKPMIRKRYFGYPMTRAEIDNMKAPMLREFELLGMSSYVGYGDKMYLMLHGLPSTLTISFEEGKYYVASEREKKLTYKHWQDAFNYVVERIAPHIVDTKGASS